MTTTLNTSTALDLIHREQEELRCHIEDSREFWITRNGYPTKRRYGELTATEQQQVRQAEARAAYVILFNIYSY